MYCFSVAACDDRAGKTVSCLRPPTNRPKARILAQTLFEEESDRKLGVRALPSQGVEDLAQAMYTLRSVLASQREVGVTKAYSSSLTSIRHGFRVGMRQ